MSAAHVLAAVPTLAKINGKNGKQRRIAQYDVRELSATQLVRYCLQSGNQSAWPEFVHRFQPAIASAVIKAVRHWTRPEPCLIDDLVQETYLKLFADDFRPLRKFTCRHENAFFGFLKVIATNVVRDHFRSSYCQKRGNGKTQEEIEYAGANMALSDDAAVRIEQQILISQIEDHLKAQNADPLFRRNYLIFQLYYQFGLTAEAISRVPRIGLTAKGVESTLTRLLRAARRNLCRNSCIAL